MSSDQKSTMSAEQQASFYNSIKTGYQRGQETLVAIRVVKQIFSQVIDLLAYPWLLLMHYEFGERFLSGWLALGAHVIISTVAMANESVIGGLLSYAVLIAWAVHRWRVQWRNKHNIRWHSYNAGTPWIERFTSRFKTTHIEMFIEPAILFGLGMLLSWLTYDRQDYDSVWGRGTRVSYDGFGFYMMLSGICLMIHQYARYTRYRHLLLDQIDQQIMAEHFTVALQGNHEPDQTEGFIVEGAGAWTDQERELICASVEQDKPQENLSIPANAA